MVWPSCHFQSLLEISDNSEVIQPLAPKIAQIVLRVYIRRLIVPTHSQHSFDNSRYSVLRCQEEVMTSVHLKPKHETGIASSPGGLHMCDVTKVNNARRGSTGGPVSDKLIPARRRLRGPGHPAPVP